MKRWLAIALLLVAACASRPEAGTLTGTVTIGPLCPVEPCNVPPERLAAVYADRRVIAYEGQKQIASAPLDASHTYLLALPAGTYTVDVSDAQGRAVPLMGPRPVGSAFPQEATVRANETTVLDIDIDTGIR